jgi:4-alpha-glucanotransferase
VSEADAVGERNADRAALWAAFSREGVAAGEPPRPVDTRPAVDAALAFVARTSAPLCLLPVEDVLGLEQQPNLPGTMDEHPNWRRRLPGDAGSILDTPDVAARVAHLAAKRPRL